MIESASPVPVASRLVVAAWLALAGAYGCGGDSAPTAPPQAVETLVLDRTSVLLATQGHVQLKPTGRTHDGQTVANMVVSWTANGSAVSVSPDGVVTGVGPGTATVTATVADRSASAVVTVVRGAPGTLAMNYPAPTIALGQAVNLQAIAFDPDGVGSVASDASWSTSNGTVAQVDAQGHVTGVAPGAATVTVTSGGRTSIASMTVVSFDAIVPMGISDSESLVAPEYLPDSRSKTAICGLATTGRLYCAGQGYGNLAIPVGDSLQFSDLTAGSNDFCALTHDGTAYCWEIGRAPEPIGTNLRFRSLTVARSDAAHLTIACGIATTGDSYCWGNAPGGRLGNGTFTVSLTPVQVQAPVPFVQLVTHTFVTCGRTGDGKVFCWGGQNIYPPNIGVSNLGVLGAGNWTDSSAVPLPIASSETFSQLIDGGNWGTCAISAVSQKLYCWGGMENQPYFEQGLCLPGNHPCAYSPAEIVTDLRFTSVATTNEGYCGVTTASSLACWGVSAWGTDNFGVVSRTLPMCGILPCYKAPTTTITDPHFAKLFGRESSNLCALDVAGRALCWGPNAAGQLTDSTVKVGTPLPTVFSLDPSR